MGCRFSVTYVLTKPGDDWSGQTGYLNLEMLKAVIPGYADEKKHDTFVCVCGPSPFRESAKR
jgi:NAD(P)H-flavin reductase